MRARTPSTASLRPENATTGVRRARRLGVSLCSAVMWVPLLAGCTESPTSTTSTTQDYCTQYEELVAAAEELRARDPDTTEVEELREAAQEVSDELDQFQALADGRVDDALTRMRERVDEVRQSAAETADVEVARLQIQEQLAQVETAWSEAQDVIELRCPPEG
jgi:superfamily II helicase